MADTKSKVEDTKSQMSSTFDLSESKRATATVNKIRALVDQIDIPQAPEDKPMIPLSLGDPTNFGNLPPPPSAIEAICKSAQSLKYNGYCPAHGMVSARAAVAQKYSRDDCKLTASDIIIASGCSDALKIILHATIGEGDTVLLPEPGFGLYETLVLNNFGTTRGYKLLADKQWELDIKNMDALVDSSTKAILINNPSNPCGACYSRAHLEEIAAFARRHGLLIISDEIYANMVFSGNTFTSIAEVAPDLPIAVCGGIAKQYCAPGWRLGWIIFYDQSEEKRLETIHQACLRMTQLIIGCNTIIQGALPDIILNTPADYYTTLNRTLEAQANTFTSLLNPVEGLTCVEPQGAMYLLVKVDLTQFTFSSTMEFCQALLSEEYVFVLPGECFAAPGVFRVVLCAPEEKMRTAASRLATFCNNHRTQS